ncbi:MAG: hypothetical protein Q8L87_11330 [Anaerolineales bacterium]|jgi:hypothetical protein|nr:hypothetical protein [Anaerolineales bacterium]
MDALTTILVVVTGAALRLAVPLALTALVVVTLRRLDARWQAEAEQERNLLVKEEMPCWKDEGISVDEMRARLASGELPCWQARRLPNGHLQENCLNCEAFREMPVPDSRRYAHT